MQKKMSKNEDENFQLFICAILGRRILYHKKTQYLLISKVKKKKTLKMNSIFHHIFNHIFKNYLHTKTYFTILLL